MNMNIQPNTQSNVQMNECKFFHYAPNYDKFYHITCQTILQDLKQILPFHLTQNHIPNREMNDRNLNSSHGHNTQTISITDNQPNFDNSFPQQTSARCSTNNVINPQQVVTLNNIPQQIPKGIRCNENTNNVPTTQAVSIADSQNNGFPQPINPLSSSTSVMPQNRKWDQIIMGINSFHGNIVNNTPITQSVLTTDINQNYIQDVNGARNFAYTQQQVDFNNNYRDTDLHNGNVGNNVTTTQINGLTYDHQDINDIQQVDNNHRDTESHNENIENNVITTQANGLICDHQDINDQDNRINNNHEDTDSHL
ncbi:hypothetical protein C1646_764705 [Rhizophagus diaphanus]|nr:hypothetical protein C1646_764705 [Rhizophagus diaphanus] [Rhizophagus sp. MUCL 43196]